MALEQFLEEDDGDWDFLILDGPSPFSITKEIVSLLDTGFRTRDGKIEFRVVGSRMQFIERHKVSMIQFDIGPAYSETKELGSPVVYIEGELFYTEGARHVHVPVRGLYSIREHSGGFMLYGRIRHHDFGYHFK